MASETFARDVVRARSRGRCEVCGGIGYEFSHRRRRGVKDEHTWCACNGLYACRTCHTQMHMSPELARTHGWHVSSYVDLPAEVPVKLLSGMALLKCDGSVEFLQDARLL